MRTTFTNNSISYGATDQNPERLQNLLVDQDTVPIKELKPDSHENTDWKSKYEILNILKNEEKGKPSGNDQTGFVEIKQSVRKESSTDQFTINCDNYVNADVHVEFPKEHVNDYPEKDLTSDILRYDVPQDSGYSLNNTVLATGDLVANTDTSVNDNIFVANVEETDAIGDQLQNITLNYQHSDAPNIDVPREVTNYHETQLEPDISMISTIADVCSNQTEENVNIQDEYPVEDGSIVYDQNVAVEQRESTDAEQVVYVDGYEINPMQVLNYNSPSTLDVNDGILEKESVAAANNEQEFAANTTVQMKKDETDIPQEQIYLNSNIETVEQKEPVIEHAENQNNVTESIQDFDAEQREMFYSEHTDKNYPTQYGDTEHPENFSENQIPQNQEFAYYENTGAEAYPAEEDVTQQYDPSYNQQYTGLDQASEQKQYGEQYQEHEGLTDQIEPQFEDLQYEQQFERRQQIEETLDFEDGYTAPNFEAPAVEIPRDEQPVKTDQSDEKIKPVVTNN